MKSLCPILLVAVLATLHMRSSAQGTIEVALMDADNTSSNEVTALTRGIGLGIRCALAVANASGGVHGKPIVLRSLSTNLTTALYEAQAEQLLTDFPNIMAFVGALGNTQIGAMNLALDRRNMLHIGPITSDTNARGWTPTNMFIRPDPWAEQVAMAAAVVSKFRIKKVALHYSINQGYGDDLAESMTTLMEDLGVEWTYVFRYDYSAFSKEQPTNFSIVTELTKFMLEKPDAVISFGGPDLPTVEFMIGCLTHPLAQSNAPNLKFFVTEALAILAPLAFQAANALYGANVDPASRVFSTFTFPLSTDTSYEVVRNFRRDMQATYGDAWKQEVGYTAIAGYVTGRLAVEVLKRTTEPLTPQKIKETVFKTTIWEVDDLTYGIFNGECSGKRDVLCECNEGAHEISFGTIDSNYTWSALPEVKFQWPVSTCTGRQLKPTQPTNYLQMADTTGVADASALLARLRRGKAGAENTSTSSSVVVGDIRTESISAGTAAQTDIETLNETLMVTTVAHSIVRPSVVAAAAWPVVDPYFPEVSASSGFLRNALLTSSTAEQEIHAFAAYAASVIQTKSMTLIVPSAVSDSLASAAAGSGRTFGIGANVVGYTSLSELNTALSGASGLIVVGGVGLDSSKLTAVTAFLSANPSARVGFFSCEFNAVYDALVAADGSNSGVGDRMVVATSLPHWGAAGVNATTLVKEYHSTLASASAAHPLELQGFVSTRAAMIAVQNVNGKTTAENFAKAWYSTSLLFVDSALPLGPYFDAACTDATNTACECNVGPRRVNLFTLANILRGISGNSDLTQSFSRCSVEYTAAASSESNNVLGVGAIAGIAVAAVAVVAGLFVASLLRGGVKRDTGFAPKDPNDPYTLVFTDIQSSTSLWARAPETMGPALDAHHEIIRKLIPKHRGYEVKTIGDAFMIAFQSPDDAVALCTTLQTEFLAYDWGNDYIDETYRQLEQELLEEDPEGNKDKAPTCKLPAALYKKSWNGLRVRCGIHTGLGDIKFDEITKGYDYYGNVPNIAARTEACGNGGQVVLTSFALMSLKKSVTTTELGPATLRGVPEPIQMYQLEVVPGRTFAPLRLDKANDEDLYSDTQSTVMSVSEGASQNMSQSGHSKSLVGSIGSAATGVQELKAGISDCSYIDGFYTMLSVLDEDGKRSMLKTLVEKWRVQVPRDSKASKAEMNKVMFKGVARRVSSIVVSKSKKNDPTIPRQLSQNSFSTSLLSPAHANSGVMVPSPTGSKGLRVELPGAIISPNASKRASSYEVVTNSEQWSPRDHNGK